MSPIIMVVFAVAFGLTFSAVAHSFNLTDNSHNSDFQSKS